MRRPINEHCNDSCVICIDEGEDECMTNQEHLDLLQQGVERWNQWRQEHPETQPDLRRAYLEHANLSGANLSQAHLDAVDLSHADLMGVNFSKASLRNVSFNDAYLLNADLSNTG